MLLSLVASECVRILTSGLSFGDVLGALLVEAAAGSGSSSTRGVAGAPSELPSLACSRNGAEGSPNGRLFADPAVSSLSGGADASA